MWFVKFISSFIIYYYILYFDSNKLDKDAIFFVQLILLLEIFHIHEKKWTNSKPIFQFFYQELINFDWPLFIF